MRRFSRRLCPGQPQPHDALTDADYQELLEMAYQQGALAQSEKEIILQIISLDQRTAREVMKPRSQMAAISDDLSIEEMIAAARQYKHRRLPIYDENPDTIVGMLNTRALLLDPQIDLADAIEFPSFVPEAMNLLQLLKSLQRQQRGLAIVLDEFGGTAGIVTMEDILDELIGQIRSEVAPEGFRDGEAGPEPLARGRHAAAGRFPARIPGAGRRAGGRNHGRAADEPAGCGAGAGRVGDVPRAEAHGAAWRMSGACAKCWWRW